MRCNKEEEKLTAERRRPVSSGHWPSASSLGNPLDEPAWLEVEEPTQGIQRFGVHSAEDPAGPGEPVSAGIAEIGAFAEGVGGDVASLHDLVNAEPYHDALSGETAWL